MSEIEVDEMFGFCRRVSSISVSRCDDGTSIPWVTKLPKFRPTMQCHVGPLRSSNVLLMCWAMSCHPSYISGRVGPSLDVRGKSSGGCDGDSVPSRL